MFISLFAQRNEPKKGQPFTRRFAAGPLNVDYPALLTKNGRLGKSLSLRRVVYPYFAALLGCVKWRERLAISIRVQLNFLLSALI